MEKLITWLAKIEQVAHETYERSASYFANDKEFNDFQKKNAEEEAYHYELLKHALDTLPSLHKISSAVTMDKQTSERITNHFLKIQKGLEKQILTKEKLVVQIAEAELSEWNDVFLYAIETIKNSIRDFDGQVAKLQAHIHGIRLYLESQENYQESLRKIETIHPVWKENILIADDDEAIVKLIRALLKDLGNIDIALNGYEALELIERKFYRLVISDIDMPIMDGIELYTNVSTQFPGSKNKFLFMTGDITPEKQAFFTRHQLRCLQKPMRIKELREAAYTFLANA